MSTKEDSPTVSTTRAAAGLLDGIGQMSSDDYDRIIAWLGRECAEPYDLADVVDAAGCIGVDADAAFMRAVSIAQTGALAQFGALLLESDRQRDRNAG